jgi:hypothetical protein
MKVTAQFGMVLSIVFAIFCLYVAFDGFSHLDALTDETQRHDRRGLRAGVALDRQARDRKSVGLTTTA